LLFALSDTQRGGYKRIMGISSKERLESGGQAGHMRCADKALKEPDLPNAAEFTKISFAFSHVEGYASRASPPEALMRNEKE
jgi:hypothetical protein